MRRLMFFIGGLALGALVGAVLVLLLTPSSGQSVRNEARNRLEDAMNEAQLAAEKRRKELELELAAILSPDSK